MAIYVNLDNIGGSVTTAGFDQSKNFECSSFQWGAGLGVGSPRGGDRTTSEPSVSEISLTKTLDTASEKLFKSLLTGDAIAKGEINFTAATKGTAIAFATLKLEEVIVSGYSMTSGGDGLPSESISLNFKKFDWAFSGRDDAQVGKATHLIYDLSTAKVG